MTLTHLSHFGLTQIAETSDSVIFEGTLASCKKMAFAHGCEISKTEGRIVSINGSVVTTDTSESSHWLKSETGEHAGLIMQTRDGWALVLSQNVWQNS